MGVTIKQLAEEVGLSWPAVSQILNNRGRFAPDTRKRVLALAAKRGYRPNASARALRNQSAKMVGILFRNDAGHPLTNMSAFEYLLGINQQFQEADYGTLVIRAGELAEDDVEPRVFRERLVDGVIVVGSLPDPLVKRVRKLAQHVIWTDAPVWEETRCVRRDEYAAGAACVRAMAELGYESVVFAARTASRQGHHSHPSRAAGAKAAARTHRVKLHIIDWPEEDPVAERAVMKDLMSDHSGVIASSMPIARRIAHEAAGLRRVPGYDFGLVCCDDTVDTQVSWPGLGRVSFDRYHLGEQAASMMLRLLTEPDAPPPSLLRPGEWLAGSTAWGPGPHDHPPTAMPPTDGRAEGRGRSPTR